MIKKIAIAIVVLLIGFIGFVATRDGHFHYERSAVYSATPQDIFPFLSSFEKGHQWNPFDLKDPNMKRTMEGTDGQVGAIMTFEGNSDTGTGKLEFTKIVPNELVEIKLTMLKPIFGENMIEYKLTPEGQNTRFTWTMSGHGGFVTKLFNVLIDCEKMITTEFEKGFQNLKPLVEKK